MSGNDTPKSEKGAEEYVGMNAENKEVADKNRGGIPPTPCPTIISVQSSEADSSQPPCRLNEELFEALALLAG
jgi:hypothetical protein